MEFRNHVNQIQKKYSTVAWSLDMYLRYNRLTVTQATKRCRYMVLLDWLVFDGVIVLFE